MNALRYKEWKLAMLPVPFFFLALSALLLIPSYPYYVTFFYNSLGIFLFFQSCRENRDVYYMMLLPVTKREMVRARVTTVMQLQLLQAAACVPFMIVRAQYADILNPVGIEANVSFLGLSFVIMGVFNAVFLPMHYKNGYAVFWNFCSSFRWRRWSTCCLAFCRRARRFWSATRCATNCVSCRCCSSALPSGSV